MSMIVEKYPEYLKKSKKKEGKESFARYVATTYNDDTVPALIIDMYWELYTTQFGVRILSKLIAKISQLCEKQESKEKMNGKPNKSKPRNVASAKCCKCKVRPARKAR